MTREMLVRPVPGGWQVFSRGVADLFFLSGEKAEQKARDFGSRLAALGEDVVLSILDREERVVATQRFFAPELEPAE